MSEQGELAALRAEVAELREEVRTLREARAEVPWWQQPGGGTAPGCTCGTSVRCMAHYPSDWQGSIWISPQNACAGAAEVPQSYIVNTTGALPADSINWYAPTAGAAGCGVPQVLTFTVPAG